VSPDERIPERRQTDESLAGERAKADHALGKLRESDAKADAVIDLAREEADEVLSAARAKADEKLQDPQSSARAQATVERERAREDQTLTDEHAEADQALRRRRAASVARLLPHERDQTDLFLLTERARSDDALASRDDFLGIVSHDLRDLLGVIVGNAGLIATVATRSAGEADANTLLAAQRIQRSASRMERLIGDLLDIASIDAGRLAIRPSAVDGPALVAEAIETWGPHAATKQISLKSAAAPAVPTLGDEHRILQVLGNLITNAVKFSAAGATIEVGVESAGDDARFWVRDTGAGIAHDKQELIFERFWQAGEDRRGLGLGLYICRCLVEAHGGRIGVESEPGAGSTFWFTIPRTGRASATEG
jgi:signal transduction histidine kinase